MGETQSLMNSKGYQTDWNLSDFLNSHTPFTAEPGLETQFLSLSLALFFFFFLVAPWHTEFPGRGSDPSHSHDLKPQLWQHRLLNTLCQAGD